jgi:hypothetical protein
MELKKYAYNKTQIKLIKEQEDNKHLKSLLFTKNLQLEESKASIVDLNKRIDELLHTIAKDLPSFPSGTDTRETGVQLKVPDKECQECKTHPNIVKDFQDKIESLLVYHDNLKKKYQDKVDECDKKSLTIESLEASKTSTLRQCDMLKDIIESKNTEIRMVNREISKVKSDCLELVKENYNLKCTTHSVSNPLVHSSTKSIKKIKKSIK